MCGAGGGPEDRVADGPKPVDDSGRERRLGPYDREPDRLFAGQDQQSVDVRRGHRNAPPELGDPRVARRRDDLDTGRIAFDPPSEGVFAAAGSDEKNFHWWVGGLAGW